MLFVTSIYLTLHVATPWAKSTFLVERPIVMVYIVFHPKNVLEKEDDVPLRLLLHPYQLVEVML